MQPFSIFVNTTDKFEDCWFPFFKTFSVFWPDFNGSIYLNTEFKEFKYEGLKIVSIKNGLEIKRATWSECLRNGLNSVENEIILYMQEDYFLHSNVDNQIIHDYALRMKNYDIDCIHLTDQHSKGPFHPSDFSDLWSLDKHARHKISCQAALWKKEVLIQYIRAHENPWQFELYGTLRAHLLNHKFFTIDRNIYKINKKEIIPYIFTGVIQGKWYVKVVDLFSQHKITVDYSKRGFINDIGKYRLMPRIRRKIKDINFTSVSEILRIKFGWVKTKSA